jgi:YVTN family beta-propeller protein
MAGFTSRTSVLICWTLFDINKQTIVGDVKNLKRVHGVITVPELHRVYVRTNKLAVIDDQSLAEVARVPAGDYPDGIAYATKENKIYVSDLHGKTDTVIDAKNNQRIATIQLGGGAETRSTMRSPIEYLLLSTDVRN